MAISYIHAGVLSRSHGRRATQFSAYISNTKVFDYVNGKTDDYTNKDDCVYTDILRSDTLWVRVSIVFWADESMFCKVL